MKTLIQGIKVNSVEEAEEILKAAGTEDLFEKARTDGEMHPNGRWVWRSSANNGKGDWRVAKPGGSKATTVRADASKTQMDKEDKSSSTSGTNKKRFFNINPDGNPIDMSKIDDENLNSTINLVKTNIKDIQKKIDDLNGKKPKTLATLNEQLKEQRGKLYEFEE